jgi:hypothetical protein
MPVIYTTTVLWDLNNSIVLNSVNRTLNDDSGGQFLGLYFILCIRKKSDFHCSIVAKKSKVFYSFSREGNNPCAFEKLFTV